MNSWTVRTYRDSRALSSTFPWKRASVMFLKWLQIFMNRVLYFSFQLVPGTRTSRMTSASAISKQGGSCRGRRSPRSRKLGCWAGGRLISQSSISRLHPGEVGVHDSERVRSALEAAMTIEPLIPAIRSPASSVPLYPRTRLFAFSWDEICLFKIGRHHEVIFGFVGAVMVDIFGVRKVGLVRAFSSADAST